MEFATTIHNLIHDEVAKVIVELKQFVILVWIPSMAKVFFGLQVNKLRSSIS
jgi:hypothetical protein